MDDLPNRGSLLWILIAILALYSFLLTGLAWIKPDIFLRWLAWWQGRSGREPILGNKRSLNIGRFLYPIATILGILFIYGISSLDR